MKKGNVSARIVVLLIVCVLIGYAGFNAYKKRQIPSNPPMQVPVVSVAMPMIQDVTEYYDFTGTIKAVESVEIRARVQGYLKKIHFSEGSEVKKGDLLFEIESDAYQAKCDRARANLDAAQAELICAQQDLDRVEKAVQSNAVSKQELTARVANRDKAKAAVLGCMADLRDAELELSYTKIVAPIDGRISRALVDTGNLVGASERTLLATIMSIDPIYVYFNASEEIVKNHLNNSLINQIDRKELSFYVSLTDEFDMREKGCLNYIDNKVEQKTGTICVRGEITNQNRRYLPGMFVRIKVPSQFKRDAVLVDERALCSDMQGKYLMLVGDDNIVASRHVQLGSTVGKFRVIEHGLSKDDKYIVNGLQFAMPGSQVNPELIADVQSKSTVVDNEQLSSDKKENMQTM